jgi:hypothetical protein
MKATYYYLFALIICFACAQEKTKQRAEEIIRFEKIDYFNHPLDASSKPIKYRVTYYFENGKPHRWIELDSLNTVLTDYIYEYDKNWIQTGAKYKEPGEVNYSIEKVTFQNDSTKITEWIDTTGNVFYTMIDNLDKNNNSYRATFKGDEVHGYDSTSYTSQGFPKRIFFTNTKGKILNDRNFKYDSIDDNGAWTVRKKIMDDTIRELHLRSILYDNSFASKNTIFYPSVLSTGELSENSINFTENSDIVFQTRTSDWENQSAFVSYYKNGLFTESQPIEILDSIYNGAISPKGDRIIFSVKEHGSEIIKLTSKNPDGWSEPINITEKSSITGGYFNWYTENELYFYIPDNHGDIVKGRLENGVLEITDYLTELNTKNATEFSPFIDRNGSFIIFTRYLENDESEQGFFISYKTTNVENKHWSEPKKLTMLPYGWSSNILKATNQFIYSNGDDIIAVPLEKLKINTNGYNPPAADSSHR